MTITVNFMGICTHVHRPGDTARRVVLVGAENGARIDNHGIPPHIPRLRIDPKDIVRIEGGIRMDGHPHGLDPTAERGVWQLRGVELTLEGTLDQPISVDDDSFHRIPALSASGPLDISAEITMRGNAACYFVAPEGTMTAGQTLHGAWRAVLQVEPGAQPRLRAMCFWNRELTYIYLQPTATITVEQIGESEDSPYDFLLHYRVFNDVPEGAAVPPEELESKKRRKRGPGDISIGCSNSRFP